MLLLFLDIFFNLLLKYFFFSIFNLEENFYYNEICMLLVLLKLLEIVK